VIAWPVLVAVETRRCVDTRSARWMLSVMVALSIGSAFLAESSSTSLDRYVSSAILPLVALLPVLAVMTSTSDWASRSAVWTFTVVPRRLRVLTARLAATIVVVGGAATSSALAAGVLFACLHPERLLSTEWAEVGRSFAGVAAIALAAALTGSAIASIVISTPVSIVTTILFPLSFDVSMNFAVPAVAPWVSTLAFSGWLSAPVFTWAPPGDGSPSGGTALTSFVLWIVLPTALGWWRQSRREVR
jgi:ABC-2 type transport system permease protein